MFGSKSRLMTAIVVLRRLAIASLLPEPRARGWVILEYAECFKLGEDLLHVVQPGVSDGARLIRRCFNAALLARISMNPGSVAYHPGDAVIMGVRYCMMQFEGQGEIDSRQSQRTTTLGFFLGMSVPVILGYLRSI
jgi:hypothetical protein